MQMNPHFIFNALSAIQSFVLDNDPREAGKYLSTFARLIRLVLENSKNEFVSIEKEKKLLVNYLELQQLRFNRKFEYNIFVDPNINTFEMMIPTMITQPFVENSIEHGIQGISEKGIINISFTLSKEHIVLVVEDNGVGLNGAALVGEKMLDHQSLATLVIGERLKLLNQKSKVKYNLDYSEANLNGAENPGTKVTIKMPYKV
jgi:LytS/YehU family sensor histidine kinase